jgi:hypothetical protein
MNLDNFRKWEMNPMSYSRLNSFKTYPCQFIINKIFGINTGTNPPMLTGNIVEEMLNNFMKGEELPLKTHLDEFAERLADFHDQEQVVKYLELIPQFFSQCKPLFEKMGNYKIQSYQEELHTEILGIPFIGYSDFVFDMGDELFVYDLKTKKQMKINHSDKLQQWVYRKALEEKYNKKVTCHLYIVTPTKHHFEEIVFNDSHEIEIHNILKGMNKAFELCNDKKDFAYLYQPDTSSFIWNSPDMVKARQQIWGI